MNAKRTKRVALYVRVSTDHQSVKNQEIELQAVAERHSWQVVTVFWRRGHFRRQGPGSAPRARQVVASRRPQRVRSGGRLERRSARTIADRPGRHLAGISTPSTSTCICISRQSTQQPLPVKRCFRCSACSASSNAPRFGNVSCWPGAGKKREGRRLGPPATVADDAAKVQSIRAARAAGKSIRTIARYRGWVLGRLRALRDRTQV